MYNEFATLYDTLVFDIDYAFYSSLIKTKVWAYGGSLDRIMDFGVGTGNLTQHLIKYSQRYVGVDLSVDMLSIAKQKIKEDHLELYSCDIRDFNEVENFSLCISTLDSTNYILEEEELLEIMSTLYNLLETGGFYIFDINSEYKLREVLGNQSYIYEKDNIFYTWDNFYDEENEIVDFVLNFFVQRDNGLYKRITEYQSEKIYSIDKISKLIEKSGFEKIEVLDFDTGEEIENHTQRILFITKKV